MSPRSSRLSLSQPTVLASTNYLAILRVLEPEGGELAEGIVTTSTLIRLHLGK